MRQVQDHYFKQAKKEGYLSRAAYKLIEIDERKKVLHPGDRVLDCGCAPGSWLQVASQRVGPRGAVVGIDLQPLGHSFDRNVRVLQGDFTAMSSDDLTRPSEPARPRADRSPSEENAPRPFDVILSDMAPDTTGDPSGDHHRSVRLCEALLDRAPQLLRPGGNLVMKVFEGETYPDLLGRTHAMFATARGYKPKASRSESAEMYVIAGGFNPGRNSPPLGGTASIASNPLRRKPMTGWGKSPTE